MTGSMDPPRRRRWWRRGIVAALVSGAGLIAGAPLWFPWVARLAAARQGVTWSGHEAHGWSTLELREVTGTIGGVAFRAGVLEVPQPVAGIARWAGLLPRLDQPWVRLEDWSVAIPERVAEPGSRGAPSTPADVEQTVAPLLGLVARLPGPVVARRGTLTALGRTVRIPEAVLDRDHVEVRGGMEDRELQMRLGWSDPAEVRVTAELTPGDAGLEARITPTSAGWTVDATATQATNRLAARAEFGREGWWPTRGMAEGNGLRLPLPENSPGSVWADATAEWNGVEGGVTVRLRGATRWFPEAAEVPVEGDVRAGFTRGSLTLDRMRIDSEPLQVRLREPFAIDLKDPGRLPATALDLEARLEAFPVGGLSGSVRAAVTSLPAAASRGRVEFEVTGDDLAARGLSVPRLTASGVLEWPALRLGDVRIETADGGQLVASGLADLVAQRVGDARWSFAGPLPALATGSAIEAPEVRVEGGLDGAFTNLHHTVRLQTTRPWRLPGWHPLELGARLDVTGTRLNLAEVRVTNAQARLSMDLTGAWNRGASRAEVRLAALEVSRATNVVMRLVEPCAASVAWPAEAPEAPGSGGIAVDLGPLRLEGAAGRAEVAGRVDWPRRGRATISLGDLGADLAADWRVLPVSWAGVTFRRLEVSAGWDDGPLTGEVTTAIQGDLPDLGPLGIAGSMHLGPGGIQVPALRVDRDGQGPVTLSMDVPVVLTPATAEARWAMERDAPVRGEVRASDSAWVWAWLAEATGVRVEEPELGVDLAGTVADPRLTVTARVGPTRWTTSGGVGDRLTVDGASIQARATRREAVLETARIRVGGQDTTLKARLPLPEALWAGGGWRELLSVWRRDLEAQLVIQDADLTPLLSFWPEVMLPSGRLRADLSLAGGKAEGWLEATNLALRPVEPMGALRDIGLRLALRGERVEIERGGATLGGQPVAVTGWLELPGGDPAQATAALRVLATNVAIVRAPNLLLRSDLDVRLARTNPAAPAVVGGEVRLRDSVIMVDVRNLIAVDLQRPERRPPYFHVDRPPLADWVLDLRVRGEQFARVLSPAFRGTISADAQLLGTLGSPRLLGEGVVDAGQVVFPFGQLQIDQARVRFTDLNPYQPTLEGRAEGMNYGYTVSLDLRGTLDDPEVRLSTVPPMSTREVVQMLTAGSLPNREYSYSSTAKVQNVGAYLASDLVSTLTGDPTEESRLSIRSGQRISTSGRLTYGVEYRLSDHWYAVGEYDRWSQFNAGIRWRVLDK